MKLILTNKAKSMLRGVKKSINEKLNGECPYLISLDDAEDKIEELKELERDGNHFAETFFADFKNDTKYARKIIRDEVKKMNMTK